MKSIIRISVEIFEDNLSVSSIKNALAIANTFFLIDLNPSRGNADIFIILGLKLVCKLLSEIVSSA